MCRPKSEPAEAPKGNALRAEKAAEAEGNEQGLDEAHAPGAVPAPL